MLSRLVSVFNTIKYLQPVQIKYQLWYRFKTRFIHLGKYKKYTANTLHPVSTAGYAKLIPSTGKYLGNHSFSFLNLSHDFIGAVDWNYMEHGKLWNYNLQYFDFLHDPAISNEEKEALIGSFASDLLNSVVKPEPYPVSLRLMNWILFYSNTGYCSALFEKALKLQVGYLQSNLEFHIKANHLLENYIALVFSALVLHDHDLAIQAWGKIEEQVNEQVLPDGGHYECSPMYHSILMGKLILLTSAADKAGWYSFDLSLIKNKLSDMLGWLNSFCFNDDSWAYFNDATGGIAPLTNDLRSAAEEIGIVAKVKQLQGSGYRKMTGNNYELLIDAGDIIPSYQPGHAHSDMLSFCLQHDNKPLLVDTGISTYQPNAQRKQQRGTPAHNTVTMNGKDQSQVWGSFRVGKRAKMTIHEDEPFFLKASHNGYKAALGITHTRIFTAEQNAINITDNISGNRTRAAAVAYFHFNWQAKVVVDETVATIMLNDVVLLSFTGHTKIFKETYQQATAFNETRQSTCIKVSFDASLITTIRFN